MSSFNSGVPEQIPVKKKNFIQALQEKGIQIRTKILKNRKMVCPNCSTTHERQIQKGVDISLATDILRHALQKTCNICIIVSGDEDFKDAIECAKDAGIKIWVASFRNSLSKEIKITADKIIYLDDLFNDIKFTEK
ncbi:NYN domain-containing protein [Candidatus Woesearchaeota archaeon]|nr:NYN domain-containing protein [Candidatus Woesearchaeota archaeon]